MLLEALLYLSFPQLLHKETTVSSGCVKDKAWNTLMEYELNFAGPGSTTSRDIPRRTTDRKRANLNVYVTICADVEMNGDSGSAQLPPHSKSLSYFFSFKK